MTHHYSDLGSAPDWLIKFPTRHCLWDEGRGWTCVDWKTPRNAKVSQNVCPLLWVVTRHQYGIFALVSQTSFGGKTSGSVAKCRLFFQAVTLSSTGNFFATIAALCNNISTSITFTFFAWVIHSNGLLRKRGLSSAGWKGHVCRL